jgi:hypothetical protein
VVIICEISGSHGGEYEDGCLLGCCAVYRSYRGACSLHHQAITLMMEAANTSEASVNFYQTTRGNNPEDSHLLLVIICCKEYKMMLQRLCESI